MVYSNWVRSGRRLLQRGSAHSRARYAEAWAFLQEPNSEAAWHLGVLEEKITSEGGLRVGAIGVEVSKVFGRQMEFPWEITQFEPECRVTTRSRGGQVAWEATYDLEPVGKALDSAVITARRRRASGSYSCSAHRW